MIESITPSSKKVFKGTIAVNRQQAGDAEILDLFPGVSHRYQIKTLNNFSYELFLSLSYASLNGCPRQTGRWI